MSKIIHMGTLPWVLSLQGTFMGPANERRRYLVTPSLIGWAHAQNDPCIWTLEFQHWVQMFHLYTLWGIIYDWFIYMILWLIDMSLPYAFNVGLFYQDIHGLILYSCWMCKGVVLHPLNFLGRILFRLMWDILFLKVFDMIVTNGCGPAAKLRRWAVKKSRVWCS